MDGEKTLEWRTLRLEQLCFFDGGLARTILMVL